MASTSAPAAPSAEVSFPSVPGTRCSDTVRVSVLPADGWMTTMVLPLVRNERLTGPHSSP